MVPTSDEDRPPADDIAEVRELLRVGGWRSMTELLFTLIEPESFGDIPAPAAQGARCQTCDYWERLDGGREADDTESARTAKLEPHGRRAAGRRLRDAGLA